MVSSSVLKPQAAVRSLLADAKRAEKRFLLLNSSIMLPKKHRITKILFQTIMKEGLFVSGSVFSVRYIPQNTPCYAFVAPKSLSKKAVVRNKLRRQGYNALRYAQSRDPNIPRKPVAAILFYKKQAKLPPYQDIKLDIEGLLKRIK
jgi:ribonuclease P protein component